MTFPELEAVVNKHLLLADKHIVKTICAFVVQARLPIDPCWLLIVGASSGGKSSLLQALEDCQGVFPLDDLTPNTFFSGMRRRDSDGVEQKTSLMDNLLPHSILSFKDFTTIISKDKEARAAIIGQLRKIYDGDFAKQFGNGKEVKWQGRIAVLAGVTSSIYTAMYMFADMGERMLLYTFEQPDRIEMGMRATEGLDKKPAREEMKRAFTAYLDNLKIPEKVQPIDEGTRRQVVELAELATRARSKVERSISIRGNPITQVHFPEMPARFATQLLAIGQGLIIVNGDNTLMDSDRTILFKIALDSIPNIRRMILQELTRFAKTETKALALRMGYPVASLTPQLEELAALEIIDFTEASNKRNNWELKENYRKIIGKFEHIELTDEVLVGEDDDSDYPMATKAAEIMGGEII